MYEMPLELAERFSVCTVVWVKHPFVFGLLDMNKKFIARITWGEKVGNRERFFATLANNETVVAWKATTFVSKLHRAVTRRPATQEKTNV